MNLPGMFSVQLTGAQGAPVAQEGILLQIEFYQDGAPRYVFAAGATDARGRLDIDTATLQQQLAYGRALNPDSFDTELAGCDSVISLVIPPAEYLDEMVKRFRTAPSTPENVAALRAYREAANYTVEPLRMGFNLEGVPPLERLRLNVSVEPASSLPKERPHFSPDHP